MSSSLPSAPPAIGLTQAYHIIARLRQERDVLRRLAGPEIAAAARAEVCAMNEQHTMDLDGLKRQSSAITLDGGVTLPLPLAPTSERHHHHQHQQSASNAPHSTTMTTRSLPSNATLDRATAEFCTLLDRVVWSRALPVLSKRTIILSEFFPFQTRHQRLLFEHGLPNFRYYENLPLAATAQPNVRGIKNILHWMLEVARRRDRRMEAEAEAELELEMEAEVNARGATSTSSSAKPPLHTGQFDQKLREVVQKHAHADQLQRNGLTGHQHHTHVLGHHTNSALQLSRGVSDASDDWEPMRYQNSTTHSQAQSHGDHSPDMSKPVLHHAYTLPPQVSEETSILWINLREEPVIFINAEPYLIRDYVHPFRVLTEYNADMTAERTERVEAAFKLDVMHELSESESGLAKEAAHTNIPQESPRIVVHEETVSGQIRPRYESVRQPLIDHVQTTAEVYAGLRRQGYPVSYYRVPLHVEEVPGLKSFDRLFELLNSHHLVEEKISVVFSCQKGGRRSTMGMVVCVLMLMHQRSVHYSIREDEEKDNNSDEAAATPRTRMTPAEKLAALNLNLTHHPNTASGGMSASDLQSVAGVGQDDATLTGHTVSITSHPTQLKRNTSSASLKSHDVTFASPPPPSSTPIPGMKKSHSSVSIHIDEIDRRDTRARYGRGEYKGILGLIRILKEGGRVKEEVDVAIDAVGGVINIRDSIAQAKARADGERHSHSSLQGKALKYLESYAYLICFNSYLRERRDTEEEMRRAEDKASATDASMAAELKSEVEDKQTIRGAESTSPSSSSSRQSFPSFSLWIESRPELRKQLEDIHRDAEDALELNILPITDDKYARAYESRQGHVLVNGSILKSDYFMGCINPKIEQIIDGAINFRPIDQFPVAGTGIPTASGIIGVIEFYTRSTPIPGPFAPLYRCQTLLWMNLREEPLLYVNEKPFVLRDGDNPYVNIEHTGINTRRLEAMERQLRRDILAESERMRLIHTFGQNPSGTTSPTLTNDKDQEPEHNRFLGKEDLVSLFLHDENASGNLIAVWHESVNKASILTPQMQFLRCFEDASNTLDVPANFRARYFRTPITDEQAPSPSTLNDIIQALESARDSPNLVVVYNCQMGRGRTTTGLIIASLWCIHRGKIANYEQWLNEDTEIKPPAVELSIPSPTFTPVTTMQAMVASMSSTTPSSTSSKRGSSTFSGPVPTSSTSAVYVDPMTILGDDEVAQAKRESEFANVSGVIESGEGRRHGWYKCIQSLVRVITNGAQIKRQVDRVIDHCGTFQNLREAVYDTQVLALTCLPRKKPFFVRRGMNYLIRYAHLLLIGAYMSEEVPHDFLRVSFAEWLDARPELQTILNASVYPEEFKPTMNIPDKPMNRRGSSLLSPLQLPTSLFDKHTGASHHRHTTSTSSSGTPPIIEATGVTSPPSATATTAAALTVTSTNDTVSAPETTAATPPK